MRRTLVGGPAFHVTPVIVLALLPFEMLLSVRSRATQKNNLAELSLLCAELR